MATLTAKNRAALYNGAQSDGLRTSILFVWARRNQSWCQAAFLGVFLGGNCNRWIRGSECLVQSWTTWNPSPNRTPTGEACLRTIILTTKWACALWHGPGACSLYDRH